MSCSSGLFVAPPPEAELLSATALTTCGLAVEACSASNRLHGRNAPVDTRSGSMKFASTLRQGCRHCTAAGGRHGRPGPQRCLFLAGRHGGPGRGASAYPTRHATTTRRSTAHRSTARGFMWNRLRCTTSTRLLITFAPRRLCTLRSTTGAMDMCATTPGMPMVTAAIAVITTEPR